MVFRYPTRKINIFSGINLTIRTGADPSLLGSGLWGSNCRFRVQGFGFRVALFRCPIIFCVETFGFRVCCWAGSVLFTERHVSCA